MSDLDYTRLAEALFAQFKKNMTVELQAPSSKWSGFFRHPLLLLIMSSLVVSGIFWGLDYQKETRRMRHQAASEISDGIWKIANFANRQYATHLHFVQRKKELNELHAAPDADTSDPECLALRQTEKEIFWKEAEGPSMDSLLVAVQTHFPDAWQQWQLISSLVSTFQGASGPLSLKTDRSDKELQDAFAAQQIRLTKEITTGLTMIVESLK